MRAPTLVYASDEKYAELSAISAVSALAHNPGARIVLLGVDLGPDAQELVRSRVESAGGHFLFRDVSPHVARLKQIGCSGYVSYAAYARIFIADVLREDGRVLYLDGDTLVVGSLADVFQEDLRGRPFALSADCVPCSYKAVVKMSADAPYFNSGVMLIDLAAWRRRCCTERCVDILSRTPDIGVFADQDLFNRFFQEDIALLSPKWNFIPHFLLFSYDGLVRVCGGMGCLPFSRDQYVDAHCDPRIFHFPGHTLGRPWYVGSRHPLRKAYVEAAKAANLAGYAMQERPMLFDYKIQYWLHRILPQRMFDIVCNWLYRINVWRNYRV